MKKRRSTRKNARKKRRAILIHRAIAGAALIAAIIAIVAGCAGKSENNKYIENLYESSSQLFSSSYDVSELYNPYDASAFVSDGQRMTYTDSDKYTTRLGIDVSEHNGEIDWSKVKAAGFDFAFIRIGYRGYGADGTINEDARFEANYEGARAAGIDVGVYFFSQAVTEAEAEAEADFTIQTLNGRELQLPVAYDIESVEDDSARTSGVSGEQFTANTRAFSLAIVNDGYDPCLYTNLMWETFTLQMRELYDLPIWFSGYDSTPSTTYNFAFWQYSNTGVVDGIDGDVDLNIQMIPTESRKNG